MTADVLIVARDNKYGLSQHTELLKYALERAGMTVDTATTRSRRLVDRLLRRKHADIVVHMERAFPAWYSAGRRNVLVPNQERFPHRHLRRLRGIDLVAATTLHAEAIFSALGVKTVYMGFMSRDRLDETVERDWSTFFHLAGANTLKGTEDILVLWEKHPEWPALHLVQKADNAPRHVPANVVLHSGFLADEDLRTLQNRCGIHLCPSRAEGWGHSIVEALSCGVVVVTTDAPPMNEHVTKDSGLLVPYVRSEPRHLGTSYFVNQKELERVIGSISFMSLSDRINIGKKARSRFGLIVQNSISNIIEIFNEI